MKCFPREPRKVDRYAGLLEGSFHVGAESDRPLCPRADECSTSLAGDDQPFGRQDAQRGFDGLTGDAVPLRELVL